jgi:hypothetical protein
LVSDSRPGSESWAENVKLGTDHNTIQDLLLICVICLLFIYLTLPSNMQYLTAYLQQPGPKLRYYGWGGGGRCDRELVLPDQKGVAEVVPDGRRFQSLINISFPKIVGEGRKKFRTAFFTNFRNNLP